MSALLKESLAANRSSTDRADGGAAGFDVGRVRQEFPILKERVHGKPLVYLDNAATSQKPQAVIDALSYFYLKDNANAQIGRAHV